VRRETAENRSGQTADRRRQIAEGTGIQFLSRLPSAVCHLPPAVYRLQFSAVSRLGFRRLPYSVAPE